MASPTVRNRTRHRPSSVRWAALALALAAGAPAAAFAQTVTVRMATMWPEGSSSHLVLQELAVNLAGLRALVRRWGCLSRLRECVKGVYANVHPGVAPGGSEAHHRPRLKGGRSADMSRP
jgi:hypothetical protein